MSSGTFIDGFYTSDSGEIYNARIQPETLSFSAQGANVGPATAEVSAIMRGSRRGFGVNARLVRLEWTAAAPDGYDPNGIVSVPILTQTAWAAITKGDVVTYLGEQARVLGKTPEYIN